MNTSALTKITQLVARHTQTEGSNDTANSNLVLARYTTRHTTIRCPQYPVFGMVLQGCMSIELNGQLQAFGLEDYVFVSFNVPVSCQVLEASPACPCLSFGMTISSQRLQEVLARMEIPLRANAHPKEAHCILIERIKPDLLDASLRLLQLLDKPADIPTLAPLIEQEIIYRLLCGPHSTHLLQLAILNSPTNGVTKAINWLHQHYTQTLRIPELAHQVGMSESSLHHHFKAITGLTPLQYQKQFRLHEARRLIQIERKTIGYAGFAVGYQSRSQFTREYHRFYGSSPLQHLKDNTDKIINWRLQGSVPIEPSEPVRIEKKTLQKQQSWSK